ncbi:DUF883 family protein [Bordetella genomosp. 13]|nr:DUF883 family protein [Bordetella genomosp. 13]
MEPQDRPTTFSDDGMRTLRNRASRQQEWLDDLDAILNDTSHTDVETLRARMQAKLGETRAAFDALSSSAGDLAQEARQCAESYMHEARECAENYVHERPMQALAAAAGVGMVVGLLLARR